MNDADKVQNATDDAVRAGAVIEMPTDGSVAVPHTTRTIGDVAAQEDTTAPATLDQQTQG